ncbi:MAG: DUF308 domain-containing protein [Lachnospiraceae bacterium]|nr:DUF308 domain-containing protein [Lachnospiraceae bacterium]
MNSLTKKIRIPSTLITSILWILLGVILLVYPGESLDTLARVLGIIVIAFGVIEAILNFTNGGGAGIFGIGVGILLIIPGLVVVIRPDVLVSLLPILAGLIIAIHGIVSLVNSFQLIGRDKYWWIGLLLSVVTIAFGALLFTRAHDAAKTVARIVGILMIFSSVSHIWVLFRRARVRKIREQEANALDVEAKITDVR